MTSIEELVVVSVCCITYNHARYIRQCLDGIVSQKTNFKYELIINDDCSTDGTTEIIKEYANKYPELIKPIFHEENQWSKGINRILATFVYPQAKGKYIALCEGDDYWTNPLKLQKQVDYLEDHPEIDICAHSCAIQNMVSKRISINSISKRPRIFSCEDVIIGGGNFVGTATLVYRRTIANRCSRFREYLDFDYTLQIDGSIRGGMGYLPECMSTYRSLVPGSWSVQSKTSPEYLSFQEKKNQMFSFLDSEYNSRFHNAIRAKMLKDDITANSSGIENRKSLKEYYEGYRILPVKAKIRILMKCYAYSICSIFNIQ